MLNQFTEKFLRGRSLADRFYAASPLCTPSRASFLSGRYPQNTGALRNNNILRSNIVSFAEVLRRKGYVTGYAGKWHLAGSGRPQFSPESKFGFEENRYMFNRGHWKQLEQTATGPQVKARGANGQPNYDVKGADAKSFTTDFLADRTIEFVESHRHEPFCYMVSIPDPHGPNLVRPPYDTMFDYLKFQQPHSALHPGEGLPSWAEPLPDRFSAKSMSLYFGMVKCIDDNIGRILAALRHQGLLEKTIVVFTSDHGDMGGEHGRYDKEIPLEASARIPFVIYAPGRIRPGSVVHEALSTVDFKPTILALMGQASAGGDDGRDVSPLFVGGPMPAKWSAAAISRDAGGQWLMAATSRYKFVVSAGSDPCLFDLDQDPFEMRNEFRLPTARETVRELGCRLLDYCQRFSEPMSYDPAIQADLQWASKSHGKYVPPKRHARKPERLMPGKAPE